MEWSGYESQQDTVNLAKVLARRHMQANFIDLNICLQREETRIGSEEIRVVLSPYSRQRLRLHPVLLLPWTSHLPWMGTRRTVATPHSLQHTNAVGGGMRDILSPPMLQRIP